mmetsp:Transcript_44661/g.136229  ORF Transcript_44661/g.136229 Transcript_44661/m.136229 type:complete len:640 (+) Transcript_44661:438-2357(+)
MNIQHVASSLNRTSIMPGSNRSSRHSAYTLVQRAKKIPPFQISFRGFPSSFLRPSRLDERLHPHSHSSHNRRRHHSLLELSRRIRLAASAPLAPNPFLDLGLHEILHLLDVVGAVRLPHLHGPQFLQFGRRFRERIDCLLHGVGEFPLVGRGEADRVGMDHLRLMNGGDAHGRMRTQHVLVLVRIFLDRFEGHGRIAPGRGEILPRLLELFPGNGEFAGGFERLHPIREGGRIVTGEMIQVPFEVGRDANVHRGGHGGVYVPPVILTLGEESMKDVVFVGGDDELPHRQSHPLGVVSGEDVPEVARGDREVNLLRRGMLVGDPEVRPEVVGGLGEDAAPVDGIDGPELDLLAEGRIGERRLDDVLTVVERTLHGDAVNVGVGDGRHLTLLNFRDAALGVQDDAVDALLSAEAVDRGRAGVSGGGPQHRESTVVRAGLEEVLEEVPEHLEGDVLEGEGRAVEQLQHHVSPDIDHGSHVDGTERRARPRHDIGQFLPGDLVLLHVLSDHLDGEIGVRQRPPRFDLLLRYRGEGVGYEQSPIVGESSHDDLPEGEVVLRRTSPGRAVSDRFAFGRGRHGFYYYYSVSFVGEGRGISLLGRVFLALRGDGGGCCDGSGCEDFGRACRSAKIATTLGGRSAGRR